MISMIPSMKALRFLLLLALCGPVLAGPEAPHFSTAGFFPVEGSLRTVASFNPGWRFHRGAVESAQDPGFDDSGWEAANLPHGLEILGENASGGRNYQGPAWYRKRFDAQTGGGRVTLYFEAVMGKCQVWVNGRKLADHFGGYLPFAVDVTDVLTADGKRNMVAVLADNSDDPDYPPGKPQNNLDFTYLGGIYRDVYLIYTSALHVTLPELSSRVAGGGVFVGVKDVKGDGADLEIRTEVSNTSAGPKELTLRSILRSADGKELFAVISPMTLAAYESGEVIQGIHAEQVRLWHPDDPYLHFIETEVIENGKVVDSLRTRFGIRLFEMKGPDGLFVNKKFIGKKLNGVNRHQDYQFIGNALPNSGQWRDAKLLREGGSNFVRAAHYPMDPAFYDACDELGILVTTAVPGWQFFNDKKPVFEERLYKDTRDLVRRDRNRPSMLLWETAINETPEQPERALREMNRVANEEYPFPGFYTVADIDEAVKGGFNFHYHGNDPKINSQTREYGDGGEVDGFFSQNASTRVKREWGEGPLLKQAIIRAENLDGVFGTPPIRIGASLWCGIDHQRGYHPDPFWGGLLDGARMPRYSYYLFKSQYDPDYKLPGISTGPMVKIAHELTQVSGADVLVYSNCEVVRLTWLGKTLDTRKPDSAYKNLPHPPFTFANVFDFAAIKGEWRPRIDEIEMVAEGLIGGKVVAREAKRYPQRTTGIAVSIDDLGFGLQSGGSDLVPVRATVVDNHGVPKVLASELVHFEVEGPAEFVGEAAARTEFGTATVLIRGQADPGKIRITARAAGLKAGVAETSSTEPALLSAYDAAYAAASRKAFSNQRVLILREREEGNLRDLQEQLHRLQLELTSKEQDLMELRSKVKK